jgi:FkbM family methyltransferase
MKRFLVTTIAGHWLLGLRAKGAILRAAWSDIEAVGTIASDQLATYLVTRLVRPNTVFVDVGAHIGSIIAEVRLHCRPRQIHAIEAVPRKARELARAFKEVVVHDCAVGADEGNVSFYEDTRRSGYSSLMRPLGDRVGVREMKVAMRRLDDLVPHRDVDIVKIDVEGAELGVLRGSEKIIESCRPVVLFESGTGDAESKRVLAKFLMDLNYAIVLPNRLAHNDAGMAVDNFIECHIYPPRTTNYFAVPNERRLEIRDRSRSLLGIT